MPDPDADGYDTMIRQERLKRQISEYFSPDFQAGDVAARVTRDLDLSAPRTPQNAPFSTVPSTVSPAELAQRRQALERVFYMADHPLAGALYGIASAANASPQVRDQALAAGGAADTAMMSATPFGIRGRTQVGAPTPTANAIGNDRGIMHGEPSADGRVTVVSGRLTKPSLGTGSAADRRQMPPGWQGNGIAFNEARGHLLANQLGGPGDKAWNLVTLTQTPANSPRMSSFESEIARRVRSGEVVDYTATPLYEDGVPAPTAILTTAIGSRQPPTARLIRNPAGVRK